MHGNIILISLVKSNTNDLLLALPAWIIFIYLMSLSCLLERKGLIIDSVYARYTYCKIVLLSSSKKINTHTLSSHRWHLGLNFPDLLKNKMTIII